MICKTYASLALGLGYCELEALAWAEFHLLPLHRQIELLLESLGFVKFYLRESGAVPHDVVDYLLACVAPWYGSAVPYYFQAGEKWRCAQVKEKQSDKIYWLQAHQKQYRHCKVRRIDGSIIVGSREPYPTIFAALDALLK